MKFILKHTDKTSKARAGTIETDHGIIHTPIFMPVGTQASVKGLSVNDLTNSGAEIILANTYHLYLRPGREILKMMGGVQKFNSWNKPMLTDSGGFQVFSLQELRKIDENGVSFKSHIDGSSHLFTPENVVDIQRDIGADIIMLLDECPSGDSNYDYVAKSNELTVRWAERGQARFQETKSVFNYRQSQFAIIQGGIFEEVRKASADALIEMDFDGYAIGGLSVGESKDDMYRITEFIAPNLPENKPRYLMGVGKPEDILFAIEQGIDMFDCVLPTRNARNATLYTSTGKINIKNSRFKRSEDPVDINCQCETCQNYSAAYIHHLYKVNELLFFKLASLHNIRFYIEMVKAARLAILNNDYQNWKNNFLLYH